MENALTEIAIEMKKRPKNWVRKSLKRKIYYQTGSTLSLFSII